MSIKVKENTKKGYTEALDGDSITYNYPNSKYRRGRVGKGVANTLTTSPRIGAVVDGRIRRLTPRECWRCMGFSDDDFDKAAQIQSDTQLYKQAGNSIVKQVLMAIFNEMI
ncbi:DNA cytosine methyltransferase [uncultured Dubosiella sp.]|uniref:DNA cytosine methyltransferase n=1 Tax=uncultured Dubosiella sp. TaxID=1937011 RepID=UPI002730C044|nr:DNA cytosine methyltransferase [uncultured Dubosiella sp.]